MKTRVEKYNVVVRETGELLESYNTREEAENCINIFEKADMDDEVYETDFYDIDEVLEPINDERVDNIELMKGGYGHNTLSYTFNGKRYDTTGEFYVDEDNILHHTHIDTYYLIYMKEGTRHEGYVITEEDVEHGGWIDIDVENFRINSREESETIMHELESYCEEKGYQNIQFAIEEQEEEIEIGVKYE